MKFHLNLNSSLLFQFQVNGKNSIRKFSNESKATSFISLKKEYSKEKKTKNSLFNFRQINKQAHLSKKLDSTSSSVFLGTQYEFEVIKVLEKFHMDIQHTGKVSDQGVDFRGVWHLPDGKVIPLLGQCKFEKKRIQPKGIREFEGTLIHQDWMKDIVKQPNLNMQTPLGIYVSFLGYTPNSIIYSQTSK